MSVNGKVSNSGIRDVDVVCDNCRARLNDTRLVEYDVFDAVYWFCGEPCLQAYNVQVALSDEIDREEYAT